MRKRTYKTVSRSLELVQPKQKEQQKKNRNKNDAMQERPRFSHLTVLVRRADAITALPGLLKMEF